MTDNKIQKSFGTILNDNSSIQKLSKSFPTLTGDFLKDIVIPRTFDGRDQWYDYMPPISEMLECGRGWIFSLVECLSSRYNIFTPYQRNVLLSSAEPIFCRDKNITDQISINDNDSSKKFNECPLCTGSVFYGLKYLFTYGAPMTGCVIYEDFKNLNIKSTCEYKNENEITNECDIIFPNDRTTCPVTSASIVPGKRYGFHRFRCSTFANVENNETTIMKEIYKNGPVVCSYQIYEDFINDYDGKSIYQGPKEGSKLLGGHSGKIVGWGIDKDIPFWIISNSWSDKWGLMGYFKMLRGKNICQIEDNIVTLYPDFALDYPIFSDKLKITDPTLIELRNKIDVNPYNYYEKKTLKQIKEGKILGNLNNFYNLSQIPPINKTNAGEVVNIPFHFIPSHSKKETHLTIIIIIIIISIILGILSGFLIYRNLNKINYQ
jgi:cathepsin B